MKHIYFRTILATLLLLVAVTQSYAIIKDGVNYSLNDEDGTAEVTAFYQIYNHVSYVSGDIVIPSELVFTHDEESYRYRVTSIGDGAFHDCKITSVVIPESVTSIGKEAFLNCDSLTSVSIPTSVTSIGESAFRGCLSLTSITIPESVTGISDQLFSGCINLTSIIIPKSVNSIGSSAFYETPWYNNQPDGVLYIGQVVYKYIGEMPANTSITIPEGMTSIYYQAFKGCSGLTSVTIPEGMTSIGEEAFYKCESLSSINIPESVTSIGPQAFTSCSSLTSIVIPEGVTKIEYAMFDHCSSLASVSIPESVTIIESNAFYCCSSLTSVTIPWRVAYIHDYAFGGCSNLSSVISYIPEPNPLSGDNCFSKIHGNATLYVPTGTTSLYEAAGWTKYFVHVEEFEVPSAIEAWNDNSQSDIVTRYDLQGRRITKPAKGINILLMSDGSTRKVMME